MEGRVEFEVQSVVKVSAFVVVFSCLKNLPQINVSTAVAESPPPYATVMIRDLRNMRQANGKYVARKWKKCGKIWKKCKLLQ